jgi:hypothetical protein
MSAPSHAAAPACVDASLAPAPRPALPRCSPGWSELRRLIFLDVLKRGGAVAAAARAAGMSRASAYALRDRDDEFDRRWAAIIDARDKALFNAHVARVDAATARLSGSSGRHPTARAETTLLAHLTHATPAPPATMTPGTTRTQSTAVGA